MAGTGRLQALPTEGSDRSPRFSRLEDGRILLCDGLIVSINRSWQVGGSGKERPVAAFKAMSPLAYWSADEAGSGDIYLAAVAAQDAYWLGFETQGAAYGVIPEINGRNAVTGKAATAPGLSDSPPNYLLVPDQPWFDAIRDAKGDFAQLTPDFESPGDPPVGAAIGLTAFELPAEALAAPPDPDAGDVQPLYGQNPSSGGATPAPHPWPHRALKGAFTDAEPCGRITVLLLRPEDFQQATGMALRAEDFIDEGEAPAPFDPFQ